VRIARLTHPIDIFVDGVERCLRFGYRKEALRILDGLLARAESDKLPLLFFPDAGDAFARDWRIAGGRAGEAPGASVASASEAADSSTAGDPARPSAGRTEAEDGSLDPGSLAEAERLVGEARALLQAIVGKDSQTADRQAVRERLDRALVLLDALSPQHDQVKKLRREVGQLLSDASRTIPF
jgi:hypothetical protein